MILFLNKQSPQGSDDENKNQYLTEILVFL